MTTTFPATNQKRMGLKTRDIVGMILFVRENRCRQTNLLSQAQILSRAVFTVLSWARYSDRRTANAAD